MNVAADLAGFSRAELDKLVLARKALSDVLPLIEACERCGMEVETFRTTRDAMDAFFEGVQREFMQQLADEIPKAEP